MEPEENKTPVRKKVFWRKLLGVFLIIVGFLALVTPLTPGSWLILVGLGMLGVNIIFWEKIKNFFRKGR